MHECGQPIEISPQSIPVLNTLLDFCWVCECVIGPAMPEFLGPGRTCMAPYAPTVVFRLLTPWLAVNDDLYEQPFQESLNVAMLRIRSAFEIDSFDYLQHCLFLKCLGFQVEN